MTKKSEMVNIIHEISKAASEKEVLAILFKYSKGLDNTYSKSEVLESYKQLKAKGDVRLKKEDEEKFLENIKTKKVRTLSGVTPVTVLTRPYPCPGKCIFCPNDVRMPKSYLFSEPGAQRAYDNKFDPYYQTYNRLVSYEKTGHPVSKIDLIILGGTWSSYPESYQVWFVKRCFDAMNDYRPGENVRYLKPKTELPYDEKKLGQLTGSYNAVVGLSRNERRHLYETSSWEELFEAHSKNVDSQCRCTGLVVETRPDEIDREEIVRMRRLGVTKVQLGVQSLNDEVLRMNKRGHDSALTAEAFSLLREAGFKIHAHWMLNLYGADPESDIEGFGKLFGDPAYRPDELKIYPCSLIAGTELMDYYRQNKWRPYSEAELLYVLKSILPKVPRYCRVTRVVRDISSDDIVTGNKKTNFRQIAEMEVRKSGGVLEEIRSREIRGEKVNLNDLSLRITEYDTLNTKEYFFEYATVEDKIAAFLRLSLPIKDRKIEEIKESAMIREIHVYGESLNVGEKSGGEAQHLGLGKNLIKKAIDISLKEGFDKLSVISAVGTRRYYSNNGFNTRALYQHLEL